MEFKTEFKNNEELFQYEKEVKEMLSKLSIFDFFKKEREYKHIFKLANEAREEIAVNKARKEYESTGNCPHYFKRKYDSYRSNRQDKYCVICGEKEHYMGDD